MIPPVFFGTLREHYIVLFGIAGSFAALIGFVAAWAGAQFGARRAARQAAEEVLATTNVGLDRNLAALTQAVDAIALEVERLSEGQRFTARLLSERPSARPVPAKEPARVITPH
jgi:cell division protein FtsB